ncbi:DNA polymerase [Amycolatopsis cynarae]|uniref:DNA polymerase n=1 Tax=Amycolatopsis cynarae TaxID=2995223 RepID=A0ABY7B595_9PSEU|nr:DNA polymerase [Amycolatopsis sp. HUAS 11-8]WAL67115.1 DNA polymerase [Amycolatopsis sp. HUAS 11-8]
MTTPDAAIAEALQIARGLAAAGIPIFLAGPDPSTPIGFALPPGWQQTRPEPRVLDAWRPGMAVCAVMGHGLDLIDVDPRNGGALEEIGAPLPVSYGAALTPSGGVHSFVRSLGVRSKNNLVPGVDVKAGDVEGKGRGFAFIAPTVRMSKATGMPATYTWAVAPQLERLLREGPADASGAALAEAVRRSHGSSGSTAGGNAEDFMKVGPWADVAATLAAGRNDGVMKLAAALRGRGGWRLEDAVAFMDARVWPIIDQDQGGHEFTRDEYEAAIRSVWERYPDGAVARLEEAHDTAAERPAPLNRLGIKHAWLVERLAAHRLTGRFCWSAGLGWMAWDGRRWAPVDAAVIIEDLRQFIIWLHASCVAAGADQDLVKAIEALGTYTTIRNLAQFCQGMEGVLADAAEFDQWPDLLNCRNGIVDLRTGELMPHNPSLHMTKISGCDYVPGAGHPDWTAALGAVPEDVQAWWQVRMGQAATGYMTPDDMLLVQVGGGENGKTTIMTGIRGALGQYYLDVSHRALLSSPDAVPTEAMDFQGARLALLEETPEARRLEVTKLKLLVGTPQITARRMRKDPVTFEATHSLFLSTNYLPVVQETDHGTWRRLAVIRFPYRFRKPGEALEDEHDKTGDPGLRERLRAGEDGRREAVLAWLVAGAMAWYQAGRVMPPLPPRAIEDTRAWRVETDVVLGYLDERIDFDPAAHVMSSELLDDLNEWLVARGQKPWSAQLMANRFAGHSELAAHKSTKIKIARQAGLSRRPIRPGSMITVSDVPAAYNAWTGMRFRVDEPGGEPGGGVPQMGDGPDLDPPSSSAKAQDRRTFQSAPIPQKLENQLTRASSDPSGMSGIQDQLPPTSESDNSSDGKADGQLTLALETPVVTAPEPPAAAPPKATDAAKVTAAQKREQKRHDALEAAAGDVIGLPALVRRDDTVTALTLAEAARIVMTATNRAGALTVDIENTGYPVGHRHYGLRTIQLGDEQDAVVFDAEDPAQAELAGQLLAMAPRLHAHSATADLVPLVEAGLVGMDIWARMEDTVIPAKLADPASTGSDPGLKKLSAVMLGEDAAAPSADAARATLFKAGKWLTETKTDTPVERSGWAQADKFSATMIRYAGSDVLDTAALATRLPALAEDLHTRERIAQRMVARISHTGVPIDGEHVRTLHATHTEQLTEIGGRLAGLGIDTPGSNKQVAERFAALGVQLPRTAPSKKFPAGQPSVDAAALKKVRTLGGAAGELAAVMLDYRGHETALSTFLEPYRQLVEYGDGRARPTVYTLGADTGRMSCVRPNFQNIPREGGFRRMVTADPGHLLISADFSSVEFRVMAALSGDPNLRRMLLEGADIHAMIAEQVFGSGWTKAHRYTVKRGVFGWAYGGSIPTLAAQLEVSEDVMAGVVDVLAGLAPVYVQWSAGIQAAVKAGKTRFPSYSGRVIHLPRRAPHAGPNYCIQGTARELLIDALIRWSQTRWSEAVLWPVHDEVDVMVAAEDAEEATAALVGCMETDLFGIPIVAEAAKPSPYWADAA